MINKTDSQIVTEMKFLIITVLVCFLLVVATIVVILNWNNWFSTEDAAMNEAKVETTLIVK